MIEIKDKEMMQEMEGLLRDCYDFVRIMSIASRTNVELKYQCNHVAKILNEASLIIKNKIVPLL